MSNTTTTPTISEPYTKTVLYYGKEIQVPHKAKWIHTDSNGRVYWSVVEFELLNTCFNYSGLTPSMYNECTVWFNHTEMSSINWMLSQKCISDLPSVCTGIEQEAHHHADWMLKYAQIAQHSTEPWEEFEYKNLDDVWVKCSHLTRFNTFRQYRMKPQPQGIKEGQVWSSNSTGHKVIVDTLDLPKGAVLVKHEIDVGLYFWNELTSEELHKHFTLVK